MRNKEYLVVLAGPTAVGKTEAGPQLAEALDCEVISADSRQFYRNLRIGTARPLPEELQGVRHHFLGFLELEEEFSAGRYESEVLKLLGELYKKRPLALLVGGSGLYIKAVCEGMNDMPFVPRFYRDQLYRELSEKGLGPLGEELSRLDPKYAGRVDLKNAQRVIRALEVCRATGDAYSSYRSDEVRERPFCAIKIGLNLERELLFDRIDRRIDRMVKEGLIDEVRELYPFRHLNALKTLGYTEIFDFLDGLQDWQETLRLLKRNSHRYARRQLTWFRRDTGIAWFHPEDIEGMLRYVRSEITKNDKRRS